MNILDLGLQWVRAIQGALGPGWRLPMEIVSFLGAEISFVLILPLLYWCVDRRKGARIALVVLLSAFLNLWLKLLWKQPRPYDLDPSVGLVRETPFGLPSGHSQGAVTLWGALLGVLPRAIGIGCVIILPLLIGFSRLYLGVHFPSDVLAGWAIGALVVVLFYTVWPVLERRFLSIKQLPVRIAILAVVALAMNQLIPQDTSLAGAFFGAAAGFMIASKQARFSAKGPLGQKILRFAFGITGTLILYLVPKLLLGDAFPSQAALIRFVRYGIVGAWVALGAPACFLKLGLAAREEDTVPVVQS